MSVNSKMTAIADPIRSLSGETGKMGLDKMAGHLNNAAGAVDEQYSLILQIKETLAGKAAGGGDGDDTEIVLQEKTVDPSTSRQIVSYDSGYDGLRRVTVNAMPIAEQATPSISVSSGGLITAESVQDAGYVPSGTKSTTNQLTTQGSKTVTPSNSEQTAVGSGVYTTGVVKVAAVPTETKTVTPTTSAQDVTPSSGKYLSKVTVNAMPTTTQATPSIAVSSSGLITAEATQSAGYVSAGSKSSTKQMTTQSAKTVTPTTSEQTAVAGGVYTTGAVKVAAIQTETKTVTPSAITQNVSPSSGKYLTKVTVEGDSNLVPSNIRSGATIFGVSGTHEGGSGGSGFPSVITAGDTPILAPEAFATAYSTESWGNSGLSITLTKNGTYRLKYGGAGGYGGGDIALYDGSTQIANTAKSLGRHETYSGSIDYTISDSASHTISLWGNADNDSRPLGVYGPVACINWDNGA